MSFVYKKDLSILPKMAASLVEGEEDAIADLANLSALLFDVVPDLNWAGFYFVKGEELVLGPFQGKPACVRIPMGKGVCGAAATAGEPLVVPDVHAFSGHIACDGASNSEMVVPLKKEGKVVAVLDLDSPLFDRFAALSPLVIETAKVIEKIL